VRIAISVAGTKQGEKCATSSQCSIVVQGEKCATSSQCSIVVQGEKCVFRSSYSTVQYITVEVKLRSVSPGASTVQCM
jgi:hypothetical protein